MAIHESGVWAHCEELWMYNPRNREHTTALFPEALDFAQTAAANSMGPGMLGLDPRVRKIFSPMLFDYNLWQRKVLERFDLGNVSEATFYTDERDL